MLTTLINSITALRSFFSHRFFLAAFLPTLVFMFVNVAILFIWSWPVYDYIQFLLYEASVIHKTVVVTITFFALWIWSYLTAALTPHWLRTLEGKTWSDLKRIQELREQIQTRRNSIEALRKSIQEPGNTESNKLRSKMRREQVSLLWQLTIHWQAWLMIEGIRFHNERFDSLTKQKEAEVETYAGIEKERPGWKTEFDSLLNNREPNQQATMDAPEETKKCITKLEAVKDIGGPLTLAAVRELHSVVMAEIPQLRDRNVARGNDIAQKITLLTDYAYERARREHTRLFNERNLEFGERPEILPTRFGNVGLSAQAFAIRAYNCNLLLVWSVLMRVAATGKNGSEASSQQSGAEVITDAKALLDCFVACFWFSMVLAVGWTLILASYGEWLGAILGAVIGPIICWQMWYGAAVEQYRVLQSQIISSLNGPLRFKVLEELRFEPPKNITAERKLWNDFDLAIGHGLQIELKYHHPNQQP